MVQRAGKYAIYNHLAKLVKLNLSPGPPSYRVASTKHKKWPC